MKYNTRHINQSGFRTKHSCVAASTKIADEILKVLDKGNYTGVLLLDIIKKKIDRVKHAMLLPKLRTYKHNDVIKMIQIIPV